MWLHADRIDITKMDIPENKFMELKDGTKIAYKDVGKGDQVVFCIPPWPSGSIVFVPFAEAIKDQVRVIALDLPGWGGYSSPMKQVPTVENYANIVAEFVKSFDLKDYSMLGYSFGGATIQATLKYKLLKPKKVAYVSTIHSGDDMANANRATLKFYKIAKAFYTPDILIKKITKYYIGKLSRRHKADFYNHYADTQFHNQIIEEDLRADIPSIFGAIFSLIETELLNVNETKPESIVIYADSDPDFIKKESREMADFLGLAPIYLEHMDHDHFAFDVNKSTDILLNFFLA